MSAEIDSAANTTTDSIFGNRQELRQCYLESDNFPLLRSFLQTRTNRYVGRRLAILLPVDHRQDI
jgi:hypothetical protein